MKGLLCCEFFFFFADVVFSILPGNSYEKNMIRVKMINVPGKLQHEDLQPLFV